MKVTLERLTLNNFKGATNLELEPKGKDLNIYGDNATGKTTVFDAFSWVLFGKDSAGRTDFEALPLGEDGEVADHEAVTTVTAELKVGSENIELRKDYSERWTRKRGQMEAEFAGHTTVYMVNGAEVPKNKYTAFIDGIISEDLFRLLANPFYFNTTLSWQKRRQMLMQIAAYEAVEAPEDIAEDLKRMGAEALKDKLVTECHQLEAEAAKKRAVMTELQKDLPKDAADVEQMEARMKEIEAEHKAETEAMYADIKGLQEELGRLDTAIQQLLKERKQVSDDHLRLAKEQNDLYKAKHQQWAKDTMNLKDNISGIKVSKAYIEAENEGLQEKLEEAREEWKHIKAMQWEAGKVCGRCGQVITEEAFEAEQSNLLAGAELKGKSYAADIAGNGLMITKLAQELAEAEERLAQKMAQEPKEPEAYGLPDCKEKTADLDDKIDKCYKAKMEVSAKLEALESPYKELPQEWYDLQKRIAEALAANQSKAKLESIKDWMYYTLMQHDAICYKLDLLADHTRATIRAAEEAINSRFKLVRFKLFDELVNGDIKETCVASVNGVPFNDLNNAMKINAGLDIINAFSAVNDTTVPIFVDNAESVTRLADVEAQIIRLVVNEQDKKLRIEQD